jgi:hypothetical protein
LTTDVAPRGGEQWRREQRGIRRRDARNARVLVQRMVPSTMADSLVMATKKECEAALHSLAKRLDGVDGSLKKRHAPDRTLSCRIPDLDTTFSGRLSSGALLDIAERPIDGAQIRLTVSSDDLLAVMAGELRFSNAWAGGRLKIEASVLDMIRLRGLL